MFKLLFSIALVAGCLIAATSYAQDDFSVTGKNCYNSNGFWNGSCAINNYGSCSGSYCNPNFKDVAARCSFPSSSFLSKVLKRQITEKLYREQRCQSVNVSVRVEGNYATRQLVSGNGNVAISYGHTPFEINVHSVNVDCQLQVPITVTVRARDAFGNAYRATRRSTPTIRGILK